jgi:hypothetical protein
MASNKVRVKREKRVRGRDNDVGMEHCLKRRRKADFVPVKQEVDEERKGKQGMEPAYDFDSFSKLKKNMGLPEYKLDNFKISKRKTDDTQVVHDKPKAPFNPPDPGSTPILSGSNSALTATE